MKTTTINSKIEQLFDAAIADAYAAFQRAFVGGLGFYSPTKAKDFAAIAERCWKSRSSEIANAVCACDFSLANAVAESIARDASEACRA